MTTTWWCRRISMIASHRRAFQSNSYHIMLARILHPNNSSPWRVSLQSAIWTRKEPRWRSRVSTRARKRSTRWTSTLLRSMKSTSKTEWRAKTTVSRSPGKVDHHWVAARKTNSIRKSLTRNSMITWKRNKSSKMVSDRGGFRGRKKKGPMMTICWRTTPIRARWSVLRPPTQWQRRVHRNHAVPKWMR